MTASPHPAFEPPDEYNRTLRRNVHPADWRNPEPKGRYNLVVVGGGTAGLVSAAGAAGLGARVALVERTFLGGDCLNVGCVPSKALLRCARAARDVRAASDFGVRVSGAVAVDFPAVMERMRRLRAGISPHDSAPRFRDLGVDVFLGEARFTGPDTVAVGGHTLRFARACIATGARAWIPPVSGLSEAEPLTNESLFSLTELPPRLVVIGGGPIGCEMAQGFARFGSQVRLLEAGPRILGNDDPEAAEVLHEALVADGVEVWAGAKVVRVHGTGGVSRLDVETAKGTQQVDADAVLVAAGRRPNVEGLGLEEAGVAFDPKTGVVVDDRLRTSNKRIFAAGDVVGRHQFTHAADAMARIVLRNALFFGRAKVSALRIPWCTYTDPEVAHVGMRADEATSAAGVETFRIDWKDLDRGILDGENEGFLKVHADRGSGRIRGATLVARHAGELLGEAGLALQRGITLKELSGVVHAYPTQAEALRKAGDAFMRTKLTPRVKKWMERILAWRR